MFIGYGEYVFHLFFIAISNKMVCLYVYLYVHLDQWEREGKIRE